MTEHPSFLRNILIPAGSALVASLGLLAKDIPWWAMAGIVIFLLVLVSWIVLPIVARGVKTLRHKWARRVIYKNYLPRLNSIIESFEPQLDQSRVDTVLHVWKNAASWEAAHATVSPDYSHLNTLTAWLRQLRNLAQKGKNVDFDALAKQLADWILQYAHFCEDAYRQLERLLRALDADKSRALKQGWNHARDGHNHRVNDWVSLCREMNTAIGSELCMPHYSTLKPLE